MSRALVALVFVAAACTGPATTPPPANLRAVAVLPPSNRTGDGLLVAGTSLLEKYALKTARVTVPEVLAAEAREQLRRRGVAVVPPDAVEAATGGRTPGSPEAAAEIARVGKLEGDALYLEITRWEGDGSMHPSYVIVGLDAALVEPATGKTVWHHHRHAGPVPTPGAITVGAAYEIAAAKVAAEILAPFGPER
jgi:hypothetical protein